MVSLTTLAIAALVAAIIYYFFSKDEVKGPGDPLPGPKGLPIIGSLLSLSMKPHIRLGEWVAKYGHIFRVQIANISMVIISDPKIAREAYNDQALLGRPPFDLFDLFSEGGRYGIINSHGQVWSDQRRFTLRHLRDFGFGKSTLQNLVMDEVNEFTGWLKSQEGKSISPNRKFSLATVNSLWQIVTGKRFKQTDPDLNAFLTSMQNTFNDVVVSPIVLFFPKLAKAFPNLSGWAKIEKISHDFSEFTKKPVGEHIADYDPNQPPRDFTDSYIGEIRKTTDSKSSFYKQVGEKNLEVVASDLFGAGSETTANTLSWAILFLTKFPDKLKKMQAEIDSIVGQSRAVTLEDRKDLPYCESVIFETLRKSSITPLGVFHYATETTTVAGYTIPKGSWIAVNQHFVHHDPKVWGDPENYRPERFLSPDGKTAIKHDSLIPFSVGKRVCIGEQIAKDSAFLFLTNIVQKFNMEFDKNLPEPSIEANPGFVLNSHVYNVVMKDRTV